MAKLAPKQGVKFARKPKLTQHQRPEAIRRRDRHGEPLRSIARSYVVTHFLPPVGSRFALITLRGALSRQRRASSSFATATFTRSISMRESENCNRCDNQNDGAAVSHVGHPCCCGSKPAVRARRMASKMRGFVPAKPESRCACERVGVARITGHLGVSAPTLLSTARRPRQRMYRIVEGTARP